MELAEPGSAKAAILDTLAEIVAARGDTAQAVSLIEQALVESPDDDALKEQLKKFSGEPEAGE